MLGVDKERDRWWWMLLKYNRMAIIQEIDALCSGRGIEYADLSKRSRLPSVVDGRRQAARILRGHGVHLLVIGKILRRHHTTIMHLVCENGWYDKAPTMEVHPCPSESVAITASPSPTSP